MKQCPTCLSYRNNFDFYKNHRTLDGLAYVRKACQYSYSKQYRSKNKNKISKIKKDLYIKNQDKVISYSRKHYKENRDQVMANVVKYRLKKSKTDPIFKLQKNLRQRLGKLLKQESSKIAIAFLGCSLQEFKTYLESKFQPGMSWDNYGQFGWHIDHIKPLSSFDLTNKEDIKRACHYSNL